MNANSDNQTQSLLSCSIPSQVRDDPACFWISDFIGQKLRTSDRSIKCNSSAAELHQLCLASDKYYALSDEAVFKTSSHSSARIQASFHIMLDTGAPDSCAGADWLDAYANKFQLKPERIPFVNRLSGIGSGSAEVKCKNRIAVCFESDNADVISGMWTCQRLELSLIHI